MTQVIVAEVVVYDPSITGTKTLYFSTQPFVTGSADSPANQFYDGRIKQPANTSRACFSQGATSGRSQIGYGEMVLANTDGGLDALLNYSFAGRAITIKIGEVTPRSAGVTTWATVIAGTMEQAEFTWSQVTIRVRDRMQDIAKPHQQVKFAGNNSLPNGLEGVAGDLLGMPKTKIYGQAFNVPLPCVNTTRQIYLAHDGSVLASVDGVYDRGAPLTAGAAYANQAAMEASAPAAGQYRVWNDTTGCYIRIGTAPSGTLTADLTQGASAAARTVGQLYSTILQDAGVSSGSISSGDISALDALCSYVVGYAFTHQAETTTLEALDNITNSIGAYFAPDASGIFRISQINLPSGGSVGNITATDVLSIERVASRDAGVGIPAWKVKIGYQKIFEVQDDLTNAVTLARKGLVEQEYRRVEASDSAVKTVNATSPEIAFDTLLVSAANASSEATRRLTLYKSRRDMLRVRVRVDGAMAAVIDLGKVITLTLNRYGLSAGKDFLIIGVRTDMRNYIFELTLWG